MVSHLDKRNKPIIVDVGNKKVTQRVAKAEGEIKFNKKIFNQIESLKSKNLEYSLSLATLQRSHL